MLHVALFEFIVEQDDRPLFMLHYILCCGASHSIHVCAHVYGITFAHMHACMQDNITRDDFVGCAYVPISELESGVELDEWYEPCASTPVLLELVHPDAYEWLSILNPPRTLFSVYT
jgi:hypothetical protein